MIYELKRVTKKPMRRHTVTDVCVGGILYNGKVDKAFESDIEINGDVYSIRNINKTDSRILRNNVECGIIAQKLEVTKKLGPLKFGFDFFEISVDKKIFRSYEVGLGKNQHYFVIYSNECVVAMIRKRDFTADYLNSYVLFSIESDAMLVAVLMTMFLESTEFFDIVEDFGHRNHYNEYYTVQKILKCKYDPDFIPSVISMHISSLDSDWRERLND